MIFNESYQHTWIRGVVFSSTLQINCYKSTTAEQVIAFSKKYPEVDMRFIVEC